MRLKLNAIPSQNLPKSSVVLVSPKKRPSRKKREILTKIQCEVRYINDNKLNMIFLTYFVFKLKHNIQSEDVVSSSLSSVTEPSCNTSENLEILDDEDIIKNIYEKLEYTKEIGIQVTSGDIIAPFISIIDTTSKLNTMTGFCSFELLNKTVESYNDYFPDIRQHRLSLKERIIMIFLKLKQGLSFAIIAMLFKYVTPESCRVIYTSMIPQLAQIFQPIIYWPTKEEIKLNIPYCFENFKDTREC